MNTGRKAPQRLADLLPVNLELWRSMLEYAEGYNKSEPRPASKAELKIEADENYKFYTQDCKTAKDVENVLKQHRKMGWVPPRPKRRSKAG